MVFGWCCGNSTSESNQLVIVEKAFSEPNEKRTSFENENFRYENVKKSDQKDTLTITDEPQAIIGRVRKTSCVDNDLNGTKTSHDQDIILNPIEENNDNKKGVTWATNVDLKSDSIDGGKDESYPVVENVDNKKSVTWATGVDELASSTKEPDLVIENGDKQKAVAVTVDLNDSSNNSCQETLENNYERNTLAVPTIVVEHVDATENSTAIKPHVAERSPTSSGVDTYPKSQEIETNISESAHMTPIQATEETLYNYLTKHTHHKILTPLLLTPEISDTESAAEEDPIQIHIGTAEYRRLSSHLRNMADHIKKLGSLIDRFDGVFVRTLHDEIESNLHCCSQNVADVECDDYNNLLERQEVIQERIRNYLTLLDSKSELAPGIKISKSNETPNSREIEECSEEGEILEENRKIQSAQSDGQTVNT